MKKNYSVILLPFLLSACRIEYITLPVSTPIMSPTSQPAVLSPTPQFVPTIISSVTTTSISATYVYTPSLTSPYSSTENLTFKFTQTSTPTLYLTQSGSLNIDIIGCNTSVDILHQMGEVTNAFPVIRNTTGINLTNVCATLSASDESRIHPDKTACVSMLPVGYQITLKLTVDTSAGQDTSIQLAVTTSEGFKASSSQSSCRDIGIPGRLPEDIGVIKPIS